MKKILHIRKSAFTAGSCINGKKYENNSLVKATSPFLLLSHKSLAS